MKKKAKKGGMPRKSSKYVSLPNIPLGGDHGTGTYAATKGTEVIPVTDDQGRNPNNVGQRRRVDRLQWMIDRNYLTMRQFQAGRAIQDAYGRVDSLSSGGPLKEQVHSTPKPDATIAMQVDANSQLVHVLRAVLRSERPIIEHVCKNNQPITTLGRKGHARAAARFKQALERVADHLQF